MVTCCSLLNFLCFGILYVDVDSLEMKILAGKTGSAVFTLVVQHLPLVMRGCLVVRGLVTPPVFTY